MASEYLVKDKRSLRHACTAIAKCDPEAETCSDEECPLSGICPRWIAIPETHRLVQ